MLNASGAGNGNQVVGKEVMQILLEKEINEPKMSLGPVQVIISHRADTSKDEVHNST